MDIASHGVFLLQEHLRSLWRPSEVFLIHYIIRGDGCSYEGVSDHCVVVLVV